MGGKNSRPVYTAISKSAVQIGAFPSPGGAETLPLLVTQGSINFKLRSSAVAEWVKAPTEMKSTPVDAILLTFLW